MLPQDPGSAGDWIAAGGVVSKIEDVRFTPLLREGDQFSEIVRRDGTVDPLRQGDPCHHADHAAKSSRRLELAPCSC